MAGEEEVVEVAGDELGELGGSGYLSCLLREGRIVRGKIGWMLDTRRLVGGKGKGEGRNGSNLPRSLHLRREREESREGIRGLRCGDAYCFFDGGLLG